MKFSTIFILVLACTSCSSLRPGIIQFTGKPADSFTKLSLKNYLRENENPKIVLRVPEEMTIKSPTSEERFSLMEVYNAIEKELLKSGFEVRDRALFNEILKKNPTSDYSKIKEITDTGLILELIKLDVDIQYTTNKYLTVAKRKEKILKKGKIVLNGASVEFKLILVNSNEIAGTYQFNFAPCQFGCEYLISDYGALYRRKNGKTDKVPPYEYIETNYLEEFMKEATRELIRQLK